MPLPLPLFPPPLPAPTIASWLPTALETVVIVRKRRQWRRRRVRSFSGVMFKIVLIKSNISKINLDPPMQLAVLEAHAVTMRRRLTNPLG